ncbi:LPXTG cell wall anchor domain-containing protein [Pseudoclavibacter terrae]|uniref:LPXTG cell wall anchor domain-containing protein n=1 Tax=Pseudoclavibacter terrae TaxID=1530195 RepID=A0A7J5AXL8_9MICO|nr:glycosyl hydrolase [Pseudoclavibacter terrae]KAB1636074.1 LPXTG cell wall anchor domain-containing protein [Pseudoclavibacter terrae]
MLPPVAQSAPYAPASPGEGISFAQQFASPAMEDKPKMRWWVPNALMTEAEISREIESMVAGGFGGAEIVSFAKTDPNGAEVSWGSQRWKELTKHMLHVAGEHDFSIDFTLTAGWPLNLPSITDVNDPSQGAQLEVDSARVEGITQSAPYAGLVPAPAFSEEAGTPTLIAVTAAKYADAESKTLDYSTAISLDLDEVTFADPSTNPTEATVAFTPQGDGEYVLFGWWEYPSGNQAHGNYEIDHYGKAGSQALIDFWEDELIPYYGDDWQNVGDLFSDSLEFETHLDWTQDLLTGFEAEHGYDLTPYLPGLYEAASVGNYSAQPNPDFQFDQNSEQIKNDYYGYLTHLYVENHLKPLNEFTARNGVQLRVQPAYGKNLDTLESALHVDIPETESLYGDDIIDFYRIQAGAVHLGGKNIYSIETAPEEHLKLTYGDVNIDIRRGNGEEDSGKNQQTWDDMRWHVQRAFSGGVNQIVFHGYSYNGQYDGDSAINGFATEVAWPGWEAMNYSNNWGERSPNWQHAADSATWIARNQHVLRQGEAKIDVAVYALRYWENIDIANRTKDYDDGGLLEQSGYTYDFVAPSGFALDNATVEDGRLDANGPAYKAVVVDNETTIAAETLDRFVEYAESGLPIIFVGSIPTQGAHTADGDITDRMSKLLSFSSVQQVPDNASVPAALASAEIFADATYANRSTLLSSHRQTPDAELYQLYNYGDADTYPDAKTVEDVRTTVTLQGAGRPYLLDAWTGEIKPIAEFRSDGESVTMELTVGGNDSVIVALAENGWANAAAAASASVPETDLRVEYDDAGNLIAKAIEAGSVPVTLDDGTSVSAVFDAVPAASVLEPWKLNVESWTPGSTPGESAREQVEVGALDELLPWREIPGLETASGIGTYSTEFDLDSGWADGVGAMLDLGEVTDTYRLTVNGTTLTTNQNDTTLDIGPYLVEGRNQLSVEVASTLFNAWIAEYQLDKKPSDYGLLGPVTLTPYRWTQLAGTTLGTAQIGDWVWHDQNGDGRQDAGEPGIPGVVLSITGNDGNPVADADGRVIEPATTDEHGKYQFNVPLLRADAQYNVSIDQTASAEALRGLVPTIEGVGDPDGDSSTGTAETGDLSSDSAHDLTLDFGFTEESTSSTPPNIPSGDHDTGGSSGDDGVQGGPLATTGASVSAVLILAAIIALAAGLLLRRRRNVNRTAE